MLNMAEHQQWYQSSGLMGTRKCGLKKRLQRHEQPRGARLRVDEPQAIVRRVLDCRGRLQRRTSARIAPPCSTAAI